jgi:Bacterial Ig domain
MNWQWSAVMRRYLAVAVAIGLLIAGRGALAAQGYVYQGLVGDPGAGSFEAMAAMRNGDLAVAYATSAGSSVIVYDNNGNKIRTLSFPNLGSVSGLAIDTSGRFVFLTESYLNGSNVQIEIFNAAGKHIISKVIGNSGSFNSFLGPVIGVNNSIISTDYQMADSGCGGSTTSIYDANLNLLSSFSPLDRCVFSIAAMGSKLLAASANENSLATDVRITDYNGRTLSLFGSGLAYVSGPVATSLGQTRVFFPLHTNAGGTGIGVFDPTGKLLQLLPFPSSIVRPLPPSYVAGLTSTSAGYFYVANPYPLAGIERFGPGTLPPPPVARAVTAKVQAGHSVTLNVTKNAANGPFDYVAIAKSPSKGTATVTTSGAISYRAGSAAGTDTFSYTVWNSTGTSTATVSVTVTPLAPVVGPAQTVTTSENKAVTVNVTAGAKNTPFTSVAVASPPVHGKATVKGLTVVYTPGTGFTGNDSFTYTITNTGGTSAPGKVTVLVSN